MQCSGEEHGNWPLKTFNSRLYWTPQVGPGHEARVQLELNSAPVLHIYDRWQLWLNPPSFFKTFLSTNQPTNQVATLVKPSLKNIIVNQVLNRRDYSQGRTVADRFSMFGQSVIVQMSVSNPAIKQSNIPFLSPPLHRR